KLTATGQGHAIIEMGIGIIRIAAERGHILSQGFVLLTLSPQPGSKEVVQLVRSRNERDRLLIQFERLLRLAFILEDASAFRVRQGEHRVRFQRSAKFADSFGSLLMVPISDAQMVMRQRIVTGDFQRMGEDREIVAPEFYLALSQYGTEREDRYRRKCPDGFG